MEELIEIGYNFVTFIIEIFKIKQIAIFIIATLIGTAITKSVKKKRP